MSVLVILSSLGGVVAFVSLLGLVIRGIFKQVNATEDNTEALLALKQEVEKLRAHMYELDRRLSILEDRGKRHNDNP